MNINGELWKFRLPDVASVLIDLQVSTVLNLADCLLHMELVTD